MKELQNLRIFSQFAIQLNCCTFEGFFITILKTRQTRPESKLKAKGKANQRKNAAYQF